MSNVWVELPKRLSPLQLFPSGSTEPPYDDNNKGERDILLMQIRTGMEALLSRKPSKREHGLPRI